MPSETDPDVTRYFKRILLTLTAGLIWMLLQVLSGIMTGYAFTENGFTWRNGVYYLGCLLSLGALIYYLYRIWRKPLT
jgi:ABC-type glycerol-3-phosphate transport system permease component